MQQQIDAALDDENASRVVQLINDVLIPLKTQVISISHCAAFQNQATNIVTVENAGEMTLQIAKDATGCAFAKECSV